MYTTPFVFKDMDVADAIDDSNIVPDGQRPAAAKANEKMQEEVDVLGPDSEVIYYTKTLSCMQLHA
jgi:hypothetical protein